MSGFGRWIRGEHHDPRMLHTSVRRARMRRMRLGPWILAAVAVTLIALVICG